MVSYMFLQFMLLTQGNRRRKKKVFGMKCSILVSCIPKNEMVVLASDMNVNVGISNVGYDGMHGGYAYGDRNPDGSMILEFAHGLT